MITAFACVLVPLTASADAARPASRTAEVFRDCSRHDGVLADTHQRARLRAAYREIPQTLRVADICASAIASQLATGAPVGRLSELRGDCLAHGGRLTKAYTRKALARAASGGLPKTYREDSRCLASVLSQARALGSRVSVKLPPRGETPTGEPGSEVAQSLGKTFGVARRPRTPGDELPATAAAFVSSSNRRNGDDLQPAASRSVGSPGSGVWLLPGRGTICALRDFRGRATAISCRSAAVSRTGNLAAVVNPRPDGAFDLWGVAPDTVPLLELRSGTTIRRVDLTDNGFLIETRRLPAYVRWRDTDGRDRLFESAVTPCDPQTRACVRVPDPTRWPAP